MPFAIFCLMVAPLNASASLSAAQSLPEGREVVAQPANGTPPRTRSFKSWRKQLFRAITYRPDGTKRSKLARWALWLTVAVVPLGYLARIPAIAKAVAVLAIACFVAGIVLAIIVLASDSDPQSRKLAKWILIVDGAIVVVTGLLVWGLSKLFAQPG